MGRLLGLIFGFMVAHIPGAMLGYWLGMRFDAALARQAQGGPSPRGETQYFLRITFQIIGYVAKANGRIEESDLQAARRLMHELGLDSTQTRQAMQDFNIGKQLNYPWHLSLQAFASAVPISARQQFLQMQMRVAMESGLTPTKYRCLERVAAELGLPLPRMDQRHSRQEAPPPPPPADSLARAYVQLGMSPIATDAEIKQAYRRQMQRHHPDRLAGRGLSKAALDRAKEKTQQIQDAFQTIQKARGTGR